jgi:hypothetical protein
MYDLSSSGPHNVAHLFTNHDAHPTAIYEALDKTFGPEWLVWDRDALWTEIAREFNLTVSELSRVKIQALRTLQTTPSFWEEWDIFSPTVQALNNRVPNFAVDHKPSTAQLFNAVDIASDVREHDYSREVLLYMSAVLKDEGIYYVVEPLSFLNRIINEGDKECLACHQKGISVEEIKCPMCGSTDLLQIDDSITEYTRNRVDDIINDRYDTLEENETDILGAKLKVAKEYLDFRRAQKVLQLGLLNARSGQ